MNTLVVNGGKLLRGKIKPQGAKNEAFQVLAACLLTEEDVEIKNIPDIVDIRHLFEIFDLLGVYMKKMAKGHYIFNAKNVNYKTISNLDFIEKFGRLRGSLMITGALLARFGYANLPEPGGDKIGIRPITTHIQGFIDIGADYDINEKTLRLEKIVSQRITLREASVTGTANLILSSVLEKKKPHKIEIYNAAAEPYIQQLIKMLQTMGAEINGAGTNLVVIHSVKKLMGTSHILLPDMIEIGAFIAMAVAVGDGILIEKAKKEHLGKIAFDTFTDLGVTIVPRQAGLYIPRHEHFEIRRADDRTKRVRTIHDDTWPKLSPDHLSSIISMAIHAKGILTVRQRMFDRRLLFCDVLNSMGANIIMSHHQEVTVVGNDREYELTGIEMSSPDIRAGMALLIAALTAKGKSKIHNAGQIHRGYESIVRRLNNLGADITEI